MTTPRDDIAGLSERLRRVSDPFWYHTRVEVIAEAATQLDALYEERTHLASLVHKIQCALMYWMPSVSEVTENETSGRCGDDAQLLAGYEGKISI